MATLAKFSLAWQSVGRLLALTALAIQLAAASIVPSVAISDEPSADFLGFPIAMPLILRMMRTATPPSGGRKISRCRIVRFARCVRRSFTPAGFWFRQLRHRLFRLLSSGERLFHHLANVFRRALLRLPIRADHPA